MDSPLKSAIDISLVERERHKINPVIDYIIALLGKERQDTPTGLLAWGEGMNTTETLDYEL